MRRLTAVVLVSGLVWTFAAQAAEEPIIIPFVTDPSPVVDGNLAEWTNRGVLRELKGREHATFTPQLWKGNEDLSGWVRFGHDDQNLFVGCHVVDSYFIQDQSGTEAWRGDHVMLTVDFIRSGRIEDVMQLGLSPGSLKDPDEKGPDTKPELILWRPQGWSTEGAQVAAMRTPEGYDVEAAVPWTILKITPVEYQTFGLQLGFSDCDTSPSVQQKAISVSTAPWRARDPGRLTPAGLADREGNFPAGGFQTTTELAQALTLKQYESNEFVVDVAQIPEGMIPTLTFKARMEHSKAGGCSGPLKTTINGKEIGPKNIADRPAQMTALSGVMLSAWYAAGVRLWFGPSYDAIEKSSYKPLDVVSYDYVLRLDGMFEKGRNTIKFENVDPRPETVVVMDDIAFSWSPPSRFRPPRELEPAPTGPIPTFVPWTRHQVDYDVTAFPGGALGIAWAGRDLVFESRFSIPGGGWAELKQKESPGWGEATTASTDLEPNERTIFTGQAGDLQLVRSYIAYDECALVRDRLTNLSETDDRPVMLAHQAVPGPYQDLWLSGRPIPRKTGASGVPANPSVVVLGKESGFAMMARDDVFRLHHRGSCNEKAAELADNNLVLRPGVTYQHEWLIFPLPDPDYWHFVNAARRHFQTNFTIDGSFCFYGYDTPPWRILEDTKWAGARYLSMGPQGYYKGMFPHGPFMKTLDQSKVMAMQKTIEAVSPQTKRLQYFNCFNRSLAKQKQDPDGWPESQARMPDGKQVTSGATLTFYFPTLTNEWGKEMDKLANWMLETVGADGLYWDCYDYWNVMHYREPWDGWTADIDPKSHYITRKKSYLTLISWPWRERLTARLLSEDRPIVANGNPSLTSEYKYQFPRFVETADISALSKTHLFTPIALGDHVTERNEVDSYRWMLRAMDWGGLYYWYGQIPTRPAFTTYMFPFTPIELHKGYIIGKERILTKMSGTFGWGDQSEFETHVFDRLGKETDEIKVPRIVRDGKAYGEVRIPEGYAVALVRQ